jgi:hypothetical protein
MKLRDLDAHFVKYAPYPDMWTEIHNGVESQLIYRCLCFPPPIVGGVREIFLASSTGELAISF